MLTALFGGKLSSRKLNGNVPHHRCANAQKMCAVPPLVRLPIKQTDESFVNQRGRLQDLIPWLIR